MVLNADSKWESLEQCEWNKGKQSLFPSIGPPQKSEFNTSELLSQFPFLVLARGEIRWFKMSGAQLHMTILFAGKMSSLKLYGLPLNLFREGFISLC